MRLLSHHESPVQHEGDGRGFNQIRWGLGIGGRSRLSTFQPLKTFVQCHLLLMRPSELPRELVWTRCGQRQPLGNKWYLALVNDRQLA